MKPFNLDKALRAPGGQAVDGNRTGYFWELTPFEGGSSWVGKWQGESPWERHAQGDEFLHVLKGEVEVIILAAEGEISNLVPQGHIFVVPKNHWHKQVARSEVTILGATPGVTDISNSKPTN